MKGMSRPVHDRAGCLPGGAAHGQVSDVVA